MRAIAICSGGLDSTTALAAVLDRGTEVAALLTFSYGQKHSREIYAAAEVAGYYGIPHIIRTIDIVRSASALTSQSLEIPVDRSLDDIRPRPGVVDIAPTFVPGRNMMFIANSLDVAWARRAKMLVLGVNWSDSSGYPDCREVFIRAAEQACKLALDEPEFTIVSPLLTLSKPRIIELAAEAQAPLELTWSCYFGHLEACGRCDSCKLRIEGFKHAGYRDPIEYELDIDWGGLPKYGNPKRR